MIRPRLLPMVALFVAVAVVGCGSKNNPNAPGKVSGSLTYNGQPIKAGTMKFYTSDGVAYNATISTDGTYFVTDVPTGELVVTVETESLNPSHKAALGGEAARRAKASSMMQQPAGPVEQPSAHYIKIPAKYNNSKTSPLTVTVTGGRQVENLDLKD